MSEGCLETMDVLKNNNILFAGCGVNSIEAKKPALMNMSGRKIAVFSYSDHPDNFSSTENKMGINFINTSKNAIQESFELIKENIMQYRNNVDIVIFSIHWGYNYSWEPPDHFQEMARNLIRNGLVDIIHGHSSHHIQGIEICERKPIIYGCGDFVDDYAVDDTYRNDLGLLYRVHWNMTTNKFDHLELFPTEISQFQVNLSSNNSRSYNWIKKTLKELSARFGTKIDEEEGKLIIR